MRCQEKGLKAVVESQTLRVQKENEFLLYFTQKAALWKRSSTLPKIKAAGKNGKDKQTDQKTWKENRPTKTDQSKPP